MHCLKIGSQLWWMNLVFLALLTLLVFAVMYVFDTEGNGIRLVAISIFPIGLVGIFTFFVAIFYNLKKGRWVWTVCIMPIGLFLVYYMGMLILGNLDAMIR